MPEIPVDRSTRHGCASKPIRLGVCAIGVILLVGVTLKVDALHARVDSVPASPLVACLHVLLGVP